MEGGNKYDGNDGHKIRIYIAFVTNESIFVILDYFNAKVCHIFYIFLNGLIKRRVETHFNINSPHSICANLLSF